MILLDWEDIEKAIRELETDPEGLEYPFVPFRIFSLKDLDKLKEKLGFPSDQ